MALVKPTPRLLHSLLSAFGFRYFNLSLLPSTEIRRLQRITAPKMSIGRHKPLRGGRLQGRVGLLLLLGICALLLSHSALIHMQSASVVEGDAQQHAFGGINYGAVSACVDEILRLRRKHSRKAASNKR